MRDLYAEYERDDIELVAVADMDYFEDIPMPIIESICGVDVYTGFGDIDEFDCRKNTKHSHPTEGRYQT